MKYKCYQLVFWLIFYRSIICPPPFRQQTLHIVNQHEPFDRKYVRSSQNSNTQYKILTITTSELQDAGRPACPTNPLSLLSKEICYSGWKARPKFVLYIEPRFLGLHFITKLTEIVKYGNVKS